MGRQLKRVDLGFDWPMRKTWSGYINPCANANKCAACNGDGYSERGRYHHSRWYGYIPFRPEENGSVPFRHDDEPIVERVHRGFAGRGVSGAMFWREAQRLTELFNSRWMHHLNDCDVAALVAEKRLVEFTHNWMPSSGWTEKTPKVIPSARDVNRWSLQGIGHDSINSWICIKYACEREGSLALCQACDGSGEIYEREEDRIARESWEPTEPPAGDGYQLWETVSDGSPVSPVFATAHELATWLSTDFDGRHNQPVEKWMKFIEGPGWTPSAVISPQGIVLGYAAL